MQLGLCVALLLLLVSGTVTPTDPRHEARPPRHRKRDLRQEAAPPRGKRDLRQEAAPPRGKRAAEASRGDFDGNVIEKLNTIIENQNQQLRLLLQLKARSPSSRFC